MKMRIITVLAVCFLMLPLGCVKATSTTPAAALVPGAVNSFDQTSYTTLMTAQASYNSLLASYKANPTVLASLKAPLDAAAIAINLAEQAWQVYHAVAAATTTTPAQLATAQSNVTSSLTAAQTALAGVKP
jgi:hypothetical protein